jgi:hypothetical protein
MHSPVNRLVYLYITVEGMKADTSNKALIKGE